MAQTGASTAQIVRRQMIDARIFRTAFPTSQTMFRVIPAFCRAPFFRIRLNALPSATPDYLSQRSTRLLHHAGIGSVLNCPPLPSRSTMTQWLSLICNCSTRRLVASERPKPHPSSSPKIAASLLPRKVFPLVELSNAWTWSTVNQLLILRPSCLTPLTRRMPVADSGLNHPLSADSSANRRIAER